jgi:hypothetical protein
MRDREEIVNIFVLIVVVACLFNSTVFGMTRAEKDRPKNIFIYLEGNLEDEIDPKKEDDLIKVTVNMIGDLYDDVLQIQYELGPGMVYTPFKNMYGETLGSKLDKNGVVTFYRGGQLVLSPHILSVDEFVSKAPLKVTGYMYVRASWDIEFRLHEMFQEKKRYDNNLYQYTALFEKLRRMLNRERSTAEVAKRLFDLKLNRKLSQERAIAATA